MKPLTPSPLRLYWGLSLLQKKVSPPLNNAPPDLSCKPSPLRTAATRLLGAAASAALTGGVALTAIAPPDVRAECPVYNPTGASKISAILGPKGTDTLRYKLTCFNDGCGEPAKARVRIQGQTRSAKFWVKATIEKNGVVQETISFKNGSGINFSEYAVVAQGPGEYTLTISKVKKNPTDKDSKLSGKMAFQTRQECDIDRTTNYYTGIKVEPSK